MDLEILYEKLQQIEDKLDCLLQERTPRNIIDGDILESLDVMTLLSLPDHLRTSASTLFELQKATAEEVSNVTNKERAVESNYLNQLVRMGHVDKFREGRKVYFRINNISEISK
ncbi:MAG: transcriptional regulator [Methanosarcinaceae archaeon]|nr:transcriptional regulator [Methanosarcinaceae archaeon]